jgi:hypothetical protein
VIVFIHVALVAGFMWLCVVLVQAAVRSESDKTTRVKAAVAALRACEPAHIGVELKDKTRITGTISAIGEDDFALIDSKSNTKYIPAWDFAFLVHLFEKLEY